MTKVPDTSIDYEDLVGYKAKETVSPDLSLFLGEYQEHKPQIKPKPVDPNFPEEWQSIFVNFRSQQDLVDFMKNTGLIVGPTTNYIVFTKDTGKNILDFF
jgi:hypothetical protein